MTASVKAIRAAGDRGALTAAFCAAPRALRRGTAATFAPPDGYWKQLLDADESLEAWVAMKDDRCVGRIGANLSRSREGVGYIGFFENDLTAPDAPETGASLVRAACDYLRAGGAKRAYGPIDRNTWYAYRYESDAHPGPDGYDEASFAWEPLRAPEYLGAFRDAGFTEIERYHSVAFRRTDGASAVHEAVPVSKRGYDFAISKGLSFRALPPPDRFSADLGVLYRLASEGFRESFLFEPISESEFAQMYTALASRVAYQGFSHFALDASGREVGFLLAFHERDYLVFKTLMMSKEQRANGAGHALMYLAMLEADARGIPHGLSALVRRGNAGMDAIETRHMPGALSWRHEYVLLEREL